jgi:hypothetical protein
MDNSKKLLHNNLNLMIIPEKLFDLPGSFNRFIL